MKSEIYEKSILIKLFFNKELQDEYLPNILIGLWQNSRRRLIISIMQLLHSKSTQISVDNILLAQQLPEVKRFVAKIRNQLNEKVPPLSITEVSDIIYDINVDSKPDMIKEMYERLHDEACAVGMERLSKPITYEFVMSRPSDALARFNAGSKLHKVIYSHKYAKHTDPLEEAASYINDKEEFIKTFSSKMNGVMGGWTRGYADTLLGRAGHTKSTMMTFDSVQKAINHTVDEISVIGIEEPEVHFWRRVFAMILKFPIQDMRNKIIKISAEHIERVKSLLNNRIKFYSVTRFKDVIDLLYTLNSEFIWIDHIQAIKYPGQGNDLANMMGGIPGLISSEVEYLRLHPNTAILNLSQVNEKALIARLGRNIWKHPSYLDAFGSQILHQHSREYLTIYYPYRDVLNEPSKWTGRKELKRAKPEDIYIKVEKSSFGDLLEIRIKHNVNLGLFEDVNEEKVGNVELPQPSIFDNLGIE